MSDGENYLTFLYFFNFSDIVLFINYVQNNFSIYINLM